MYVFNQTGILKKTEEVKEKIKAAALKHWRSPADITVLAASKARTIEEIKAAFNCGITVFGENYVQEFLPKYEALHGIKEIKWHIIGRLQKNKVKHVVGKICLIHSVNSAELADVIDAVSFSKNTAANILLEINLSKEPAKTGLFFEDAIEAVIHINKLNNVVLKGFMTMPPLSVGGEDNRKYFKILKQILEDVNYKAIYKSELNELSMGTSDDYEVAVEEGATIVRLGTVIFGKRPPKIKTNQNA